MRLVEAVFDTGDLITASELSSLCRSLQEIYDLALVTEAELISTRIQMPPLGARLSKIAFTASNTLEESSELAFDRIRMDSPLLAGLVVPGTGLAMLSFLRMIRDWSSTREHNRLENQQLRAEVQVFRREHGLSEQGDETVLEALTYTNLPRVLSVAREDQDDDDPGRAPALT